MLREIDRLTPRQLEVLELLAKGLTNREIGDVLRIAPGTAKLHVSAVIDALDVSNRTEAAVVLQEFRGTAAAPEARVPGFGDRPAIVVLPFDNFSPDPEQAFFADALVEDLTTQLGVWRWFPVIARNTAFAMRGRTVPEVGRELGARYVVEGSTRASRDRVRINVQVIDAENGDHVFAAKYDRAYGDVLDVQDEIVESIVGALEPLLCRIEGVRAHRKPVDSLDAWEQVHRGVVLLQGLILADAERALRHMDRAIELEPTLSIAHGGRAAALLLMGLARIQSVYQGDLDADQVQSVTVDALRCFFDALEAGRRAATLDPLDANCVLALASGLFMTGQREAAIGEYRRALDLNPNSAIVCLMAGNALSWTPDWREAVPLFERALRLSPHDPLSSSMCVALGCARLREGRDEEGVDLIRRATEHEPPGTLTHRPLLAAALAMTGRLAEGREVWAETQPLVPGFDGRVFRQLVPPELSVRLLEALGAVGWEE